MTAMRFHCVEPTPGFGVLMRRLRDAAGLSQDGLADTLNVHRNQVSDYERGRRRPNHGRVRELDKLLGGGGALVRAASLPARLWAAEREIARLTSLLERQRSVTSREDQMGWKKIENPSPAAARALPPDGVAVGTRKAPGGSRYITIKVGADLARRAAFTQAKQRCSILVGTGPEAGQLCIASDASGGAFLVKRDKKGAYMATISALGAAGLFTLDFEAFTAVAAIIPAGVGSPVSFTFPVPDKMLAGGD